MLRHGLWVTLGIVVVQSTYIGWRVFTGYGSGIFRRTRRAWRAVEAWLAERVAARKERVLRREMAANAYIGRIASIESLGYYGARAIEFDTAAGVGSSIDDSDRNALWHRAWGRALS